METDRELLELAAKAAGMWKCGFLVDDNDNPIYLKKRGFKLAIERCWWNPLTNDGDALRLAVRCAKMLGFYRFLKSWLVAMVNVNGYQLDPYSATRRAIVRAAAEIGKGMK